MQFVSLRDYFAAAALDGWLSSYGVGAQHPCDNFTHDQVASDAYGLADAMIKARDL